jgi:hypothetical protein
VGFNYYDILSVVFRFVQIINRIHYKFLTSCLNRSSGNINTNNI